MQLKCTLLLLTAVLASAAEAPYFVTYTHRMEEPGNLEVASNQVVGNPRAGNPFVSTLFELEYGVTAWWTSELYLSGQSTAGQGSLFTGYRIENRFRPLLREHWINPVIYVEFANVNGADRSLREIVGHDSVEDALEPTSETRLEKKREIETRLILSSNFKGWNLSENIIAEKNLSNEPWEFGYAVALSRPLALAASPTPCRFCRENFRAGVELYGGLGTRHEFGLRDTSHYIAPTLAWRIPNGPVLSFSPGIGLNDHSHGVLFRFTAAYEIQQFAQLFRRSK